MVMLPYSSKMKQNISLLPKIWYSDIILMVDLIAQLVEQQAQVLVMGTLSEGCAQGREFESHPGMTKQ